MYIALAGLALLSLLPATFAEAGGRSGGGREGGGRLGQVSSGLGDATSGGGAGTRGSNDGPLVDGTYEGDLYVREQRGDELVFVARDGTVVRRVKHRREPYAGRANVDLFVGIQKVHESDGSASASLAIEDRWFRLAGAVTRYHEDQMDGSRLSLTVPTATLGVRLDDRRGDTRAFLEGGAALAITRNDPTLDTSVTGPIVGVHLEHRLGRPSLIGDAHAMFFDDGVRAYAARVGVRLGHFEAALRVLDFNVGPALFGPEVGLRF